MNIYLHVGFLGIQKIGISEVTFFDHRIEDFEDIK
jgi:hypothetical protein